MFIIKSKLFRSKCLNIVLLSLFTVALFCLAGGGLCASIEAQTRKSDSQSDLSYAIDCCHVLDYRDKNGNLVFGYIAYVNLSNAKPFVPTIQTDVCKGEYPNPAFTSEIAAAVNPSIELSVNANFWLFEDRKANFHDLSCEGAIGLAVSEGKIISSPGKGINETSVLPDSILFYDSKDPAIIPQPTKGYKVPPGVHTAVSGIWIVRNGNNESWRAKDAKIKSDNSEARTAMGLTKDNKTLIVVVIEGGVSRSVGVNLSDLADKLISLGAYQVINLDGGGSSALNYYARSNDYQVMSIPEDTYPMGSKFSQYRPTPVHLAFVAKSSKQQVSLKNRLIMGTPIPQNTSFDGDFINVIGSYNFISNSSLAFRGRDRIIMPSDSAVFINRPKVSDFYGSFKAQITDQSTERKPTEDFRIKGMVIDSDGKVGIGTTQPQERFSIQGNSEDTAVFSVSDDGKAQTDSLWVKGLLETGSLSVTGPLKVNDLKVTNMLEANLLNVHDLSVTNMLNTDYLTVTGPLWARGGIVGLGKTNVFTAYRKNSGTDVIRMSEIGSSMCFLTKVYQHGDFGSCQIDIQDGYWTLGAVSYNNNEVGCQAYCMTGIPFAR